MQNNISPKARRRARVIAMQVLYQYQVAQNAISEILAQSRIANEHFKVDWAFCEALVMGASSQLSELDALIEPILFDPIFSTNPVELAILRLGVFELKNRLDIPYRVVISQYVDIAMEYGAQEGQKFVNGVLDQLVPSLRAIEVERKK